MTQDQYGQAHDSGYAAHGQVAEDDETEEFQDEQDKPMTRFQKVASALRGDRADRDEPDPNAEDPAAMAAPGALDPNGMAPEASAPPASPPWEAHRDEAVAASSPDTLDAGDADALAARDMNETHRDETVAGADPAAEHGDYWDTPARRGTGQDQVDAVTSPDVPATDPDADPLARQDTAVGHDAMAGRETGDTQDPTATQPDMYGTGAATIPDGPVTQMPAGTAETEAPGAAGQHAAAPSQAEAQQELHPGEAAGTLGDLGDLAYGKLIPDAADFTAQWQQIQFKFVDDPHASVMEAADVVAQVTAKLEAAIQERQRAIEASQQAIQERQRSLRGRWGEGTEADTETLRETLRMYKAFLDQLVGPKA
jgi:hypothetical protein